MPGAETEAQPEAAACKLSCGERAGAPNLAPRGRPHFAEHDAEGNCHAKSRRRRVGGRRSKSRDLSSVRSASRDTVTRAVCLSARQNGAETLCNLPACRRPLRRRAATAKIHPLRWTRARAPRTSAICTTGRPRYDRFAVVVADRGRPSRTARDRHSSCCSWTSSLACSTAARSSVSSTSARHPAAGARS